jgi:hypothetical protein
MSAVADAWDNWLKALEAHGFNARAMTRPATSDVSALPGQLADLYRISDGQAEAWRGDLPGATDLFPCARFLPFAEVGEVWPEWADLGVPFTLDAGGGSLAVDPQGRVVALEPDEQPRVVAPSLVAYLVALAAGPLQIDDDEGELTWDAPRLR